MVSSESLTLPEIESSIWQELTNAVESRSHWRFPVLATTHNGEPRARTIVLRSVDLESRNLVFHTDARSPKVDQLNSNADVSLVFYDHDRLVQLAVAGHATLHFDDAVANQQWTATPPSSRRAYLGAFVPGTPTAEPEANLPTEFVGRVPEASELQPARVNFAVIVVDVESIDWLKLDRSSNLRARFSYATEPSSMTWVAP